jgi:signal transduction histidine kinase
MKTLYRQYILATLLILSISIMIGFLLTNVVYMMFTRDIVIDKNLKVAEQLVQTMDQYHASYDSIQSFLKATGDMGYQIFLISATGEAYYYGQPFARNRMPEPIIEQVMQGSPYHGRGELWARFWMMGHLANDIRNTVGLPVQIAGEKHALFVKADNKLMLSELHMMLAGFIAAIVSVSLLGVIILTRRIIQPISELSEATKAIINGDYSYSLDIRRKDELGQLAEHFMLMQQQLHHNDAARKSFISNVSHDFQSPLMNIQGYAELLLSPDIKEDERLQYAGIVRDEARRLSNLTKQLLLITSLDQTGYPIKKDYYRLDLQIKDLLKKYQWSLQESDVTITYKLEEAVVYSDRELLANVWDNLITNAIKYNRPGGQIFVSCRAEGDKFVLTFADTGIGLTEEEAERIFERFYRVDTTRKKGGSGLGLSIVQDVLTLLNGTISLESKPGEGTIFTVVLPKEG